MKGADAFGRYMESVSGGKEKERNHHYRRETPDATGTRTPQEMTTGNVGKKRPSGIRRLRMESNHGPLVLPQVSSAWLRETEGENCGLLLDRKKVTQEGILGGRKL